MSCESGSQRVLNRGGHFWYNFNFPMAIGLRKNYRNIRQGYRTSTNGLAKYRLPSSDWTIYCRVPGFLAVVWSGACPTPPPPLPLSTGDTQKNWERETTCWRDKGEKRVGEELNYPTAWRKSVVINESFNILWWDLLSCLWPRSRWTYNFMEISGIIFWDFSDLRFPYTIFHYKPVSNHFCSREEGE